MELALARPPDALSTILQPVIVPPRRVDLPVSSAKRPRPRSPSLSQPQRRLGPRGGLRGRPATDSDTAAHLLKRIAEGDDEALRRLYREYGRLAFTIAFRILGKEERAEDAVQEAFVRVWKNAATFDPSRAAFSTWLSRVVRNLCIDMLRRKDPLDRAGALSDVEAWLAYSDPVEPTVVNRLTIRDAFLQIPATQSRVLEMAYFEGLTHREIAERLEIPEGTVKSRMRLGLQRMRTYLLHAPLQPQVMPPKMQAKGTTRN
jgi:RNA polymerase sigma-70 factor (ECF subfamily)